MNFPTSIDTALTLLTAVNNLVTSLDGVLAADANGNQSSATRIYVASTTNFPASGDIIIGNETEGFEVISYTSKAATYFDGITRGTDGTVSIVHATGVNVKNGINAHYHNLLRDAVIAMQSFLIVDGYERYDINPWNYTSITQGTWGIGPNTGIIMVYPFSNNVGVANGDRANYNVALSGGTYTIRLHFVKDDFLGIYDILVDGVSKGTVDGYNAFLKRDNAYTITGIPITSGTHSVSVKVTGKNGASSNYVMFIDALAIWRTA